MKRKEFVKVVASFGSVILAGAGYAAEVPSEFQTGMTWGLGERAGYFETAEARAEVDRTFKDEKWCRGFYWWRWSNRNHSTGRMNGVGEGFSPLGLPAIDVMRRIYGE